MDTYVQGAHISGCLEKATQNQLYVQNVKAHIGMLKEKMKNLFDYHIKDSKELDKTIKKLNKQEGTITNKKPQKISISFREAVPEIPSTTHGAFSIYKYPAKFIPQVIAHVLKNYGKPDMKVFDPFAGYGTVGVVCRIHGYAYELWDLNPIMNTIHNTAILENPEINISKLMADIKMSHEEFIPEWSNLGYWFPEDFIPTLAKTWGFVHSLENKNKYILLLPLLKATRYFSYSDEKIPKLYRSKFAKKKIGMLLKADFESEFYRMLENEIRLLIKKIGEYKHLNPKSVKYRIKSGIDVLETRLDNEVDILITSPPYLQAQEYIRSTKLELFWLGYEEDYIKHLNKKEIPYGAVNESKIYSEKYYEYRKGIKEDHLRKLYDRYFHAISKTFSTLGENVKDRMFIFVGPAKVRATSIPIDDIVIEHLREFGWKHEVTFVDKIISRSMFKADNNSIASGNESRMETENLVVLKKEK